MNIALRGSYFDFATLCRTAWARHTAKHVERVADVPQGRVYAWLHQGRCPDGDTVLRLIQDSPQARAALVQLLVEHDLQNGDLDADAVERALREVLRTLREMRRRDRQSERQVRERVREDGAALPRAEVTP